MYEYVPASKTMPNEVSYTTPSDVKEELLSSADVDDSQIIVTYEVNQDDLNNYKKVQNYKPGKANPFASGETTDSSNATNTTNGNSSTGNSNNGNTGSSSTGNTSAGSQTGGSSNTDSNTTTSGGSYFPDKGTK